MGFLNNYLLVLSLYVCLCVLLSGSLWPTQHKRFFFSFVKPESGGNVSSREVQRLKKKNIQLEEENNVLKLKIELLLDMVRSIVITL